MKIKKPKKTRVSDIKIRKSWGVINPATRVEESKKKYSRAQHKKDTQRDFLDL